MARLLIEKRPKYPAYASAKNQMFGHLWFDHVAFDQFQFQNSPEEEFSRKGMACRNCSACAFELHNHPVEKRLRLVGALETLQTE